MNLFAFCEERLGRLSEARFWLVLLSVLAAIVILLISFAAIDENRNFLTVACDTAAFQSTIANTLAGRWFRDTAYDGPNYLGLHCVPILVPLACLHAILPLTDAFFALQVAGIYIAAIPLYLLAVELTGKPSLAFYFAASILPCPLLLHMSMAPFHPESWIFAAVLWCYVFYRWNQPVGFWISLGFGLSCSEQASLPYAALGMALLLRPDGLAWRRRYGAILLVTALAWLIFSVGFVIPRIHDPCQHNLTAYHYANWDVERVSDLARAIVSQPALTASLLFSSGRWFHLLGLVGLPLVMTIFSLRALILMAPFPVYFLMSDQEFNLDFHAYYFQFALLAAYLGLLAVLARVTVAGRLGPVLCCATLFCNVLLFVSASVPYILEEQWADEDLSSALHQAFSAIPEGAGVYVQHRYSAYLSDRQNMVMGDLADPGVDFDTMIDDEYVQTTVHARDIDYIVCDFRTDQCGPRMGDYHPAMARARMDNVSRLVQGGEWRVVWAQNEVVILCRAQR